MARRKRQNKKIISLLLSLLLLSTYFIINQVLSYSKEPENKNMQPVSTNLEIYYLDVGQADSILITNNGHNLLIDAGNNEDGEKLVNYFKSLGIEKFDYVVGTHPHEDHIGGLDDIINNFSIETILLPEAYTTTKTFEDVLNAIENHNFNITVPQIDETFKLEEANIKVIYTGNNATNLNDASIVLQVSFGMHKFLFTGDATKEVEKKILTKDIEATVLKVGHHGSAYSTTEEFLNKVKPQYAIISVGKNNSYNHPADSTIKRLENYHCKIYKTSELGTIKVTSDGISLDITNFITDTNG